MPKGYVRFFSLLAIIGYTFNLCHQILDVSRIPSLVDSYHPSSETIREVIEVYEHTNVHLFILSLGLPDA
jgi:hypothetical protein